MYFAYLFYDLNGEICKMMGGRLLKKYIRLTKGIYEKEEILETPMPLQYFT